MMRKRKVNKKNNEIINLNQEEDDIIVQGSKDTSDKDAEDKGEEGRVSKGQEEEVDV